MNYSFLILIICLKISSLSSKRVKDDEVVKWIKDHGYQSEAYKVETEDGYILKLHRIAPKNNKGCKIPVFLMHSCFTNSFYFVRNANVSIAFYLADEGYEVFLGNSRGNKYSLHHKKYDTESIDYWRFSYYEMGLYDLPALIDYSLMLSGSSKIFFVGHSQSTTEVLVLLSLKPEYNKKIIQSHLMGTIGAYRYPARIPKALAFVYPMIKDISIHLPYVNFGPANTLASTSNFLTCFEKFPIPICQWTHFALMGGTIMSIFRPNIDPAVHRTIASTLSRRTSVQQLMHYIQSSISGKFRPFDYGPKENLRIYGAREPPDYPLENISSDIYLYVGERDRVFTKRDTDLLAPQLPNAHYRLLPEYNHLDYFFARDAPEKVYKVMHREFEKGNRQYQNEIFNKCGR